MPTIEQFIQVNGAYPWLTGVFITLFGGLIGSFLNVCIYRIPAEKSVVYPGSHCACGRAIAWYDNIPVLSWLVLRGKARCCGAKFSWRYPAIEALTALLFCLLWHRLPLSNFVPMATLFSCLIAGAFIDFDHKIIPDRFTMGLAAVGFVFVLFQPSLHLSPTLLQAGRYEHPLATAFSRALIGGAVGSAIGIWIAFIGEKLMGVEAFGMADVKLLGALGVFLGWQAAVFSMFGGSVVGCALLPIFAFIQRNKGEEIKWRKTELPFGPSIAIAAILYVLFFKADVAVYWSQFAPLFSE